MAKPALKTHLGSVKIDQDRSTYLDRLTDGSIGIRFVKKLSAQDIEGLRPEEVRRGKLHNLSCSKRIRNTVITGIVLSPEAAEALRALLKDCLK